MWTSGGVFLKLLEPNSVLARLRRARVGRAKNLRGSESEINNFKFLIELSITQFSELFNLKFIEKFTGFGGKFSQK